MIKRIETGLTPPELRELEDALKTTRLAVWSYINRYPKNSKEVRRFKALERAVGALRDIICGSVQSKDKKNKSDVILGLQIDMFE